MAAFSTLALIGLGAAIGTIGSKLKSPKPTNATTPWSNQPSPEAAKASAPISGAPPSASQAASTAAAAGNTAAQRARRRASAGGIKTPGLTPPQAGVVGSSSAKTLIGY